MRANVYKGSNGLVLNNTVIHIIENDKIPDVERWCYDRVRPYGLIKQDFTIIGNCHPDIEVHHLHHAHAAYAQSQFDDASILVIDGMNKLNGISIAIYTAKDKVLTEIKTYSYRYSLGSYYANGVHLCGFGLDETRAGRLMGLSSYSSYTDDHPIFFTVDPYTGDIDRCDAIFEIIDSELKIKYLVDDYIKNISHDKLHSPLDTFNFDAAIAAANIQHAFELSVFSILEYMYNTLPSKNLILTGGCALNCVNNGKIIRSKKWDDLFIPNMCEDKGNIVGRMVLEYNQTITSPFIYNKVTYPIPKEYNREISKEELANKIKQGTIVAWFEGGSEYGPRALCHRSLLADPTLPWIGYRLNEIKHREYWRPLAPVVLDTHFKEYFDVDGRIWHPHRVMLATEYIRDRYQRQLQPICAADNSSRPQVLEDTVNNHTLYSIMRDYDLPILVNTSMNDAGESICEFPEDAIHFCSNYNDVLLVFVKYDKLYIK